MFDNKGDVLLAQGDLPGALKSYRDSLAISEQAHETGSWQCRLAARSFGELRQSRRRAEGSRQSAWSAQELPRQPGYSRQARETGPWQCWLAARSLCQLQQSRQRAEGSRRSAGALKSYRDSLAIARSSPKQDPGNAGWQRDLSVSYDKVGDVLSAQGNLPARSRATATAWLFREARQAGPWQCRLAARSLGQLRQSRRRAERPGRSGGALKSYRDSLAIARSSRKQDPGNAGWQRDLSVSYDNVGDVQSAQGDLAGALKSYRDSLAIRDKLAKQDPAMPAGRAISRFLIGEPA